MAEKPEKQLEELSSEQLREQIERDKKQVRHSFFMSFTALIAIIALCIAWFVANNIANAGTSSISGKSDQAFLLASVGTADSTIAGFNEKLGLTKGSEQQYKSYFDLESSTEVTSQQERTYHVGTADLMWYLNRNDRFSPGSSGKLEFYIIPQFDGLTSATFTVTLNGYTTLADNTPSISEEKKAQNLLKGHILLFQHLSDKDGYSGWLSTDGETNTLTVQAPEADGGKFQKGKPYKVSFYWVWPKYFRNYIYNSRVLYGDLFTDITANNTDYTNLVEFVNQQRTYETSKLFYGNVGAIGDVISSSMSDSLLDTCTAHYDAADEYIGSQIKYVYIDASLYQKD